MPRLLKVTHSMSEMRGEKSETKAIVSWLRNIKESLPAGDQRK